MAVQLLAIALAAAMATPPASTPQAAAEPIGTYQQCVDYPVPGSYRWSRNTIEAFCADTFTKTLGSADIARLVDAGQGKALDAALDKIVGDYLAGNLPEGAAFYVYANFNRGD